MRKLVAHLVGWLALVLGLALADASDTKTFTVTVSGVESVTIDTGTAPLTVSYDNTTYCSKADRLCAWYPTIIYSTNYTTNRQLVASATTSHTILSVVLEKQEGYPDPFTPTWGSGTQPGVWGSDFTGASVTLSSTNKQIVQNIQNGTYAIAPKLKLVFSDSPPAGEYSAEVTFTIMAQ